MWLPQLGNGCVRHLVVPAEQLNTQKGIAKQILGFTM
jgi:hypothetical protein